MDSIHVIIDKIYFGIVNHHFFLLNKLNFIYLKVVDMVCEKLLLCTLYQISLKRGYSQIL